LFAFTIQQIPIGVSVSKFNTEILKIIKNVSELFYEIWMLFLTTLNSEVRVYKHRISS
jgi:hypothetical protein